MRSGPGPDRNSVRICRRPGLLYFFLFCCWISLGQQVYSGRAEIQGKWVLLLVSGAILFSVPNFMISNEIPVDIFRGNHGYLLCGLTNEEGMILRLLMYLVSFILIVTFFAVLPDRKLPWTFIGRNTMGIYFFHYPIMIVMNGLLVLKLPGAYECVGADRRIAGVCPGSRQSAGGFLIYGYPGSFSHGFSSREISMWRMRG